MSSFRGFESRQPDFPYLIGASPGVAPVVIQADVPDASLDTVTVTIPTGGASKFFARLKVTNSR